MPKKSVHFYIPTNGVRDDILALMNEFVELKTVRFSEFSKIWRAKKMSFLCAGRFSDKEAREFIERTLMIALDFFLPPYQFQIRVGGLYLLYAIYETQPIKPRAKVRLTQSQWNLTMSFQQEAAQQNHLDVVYVFNKMLQDHAFHLCFTASEMSTRNSAHEAERPESNLTQDMTEDRRDIDALFNYEAMEQLSYLLDHYQQMKVNLAGPEATQPDKSLDVVHGTMVEDLVTMLQSFKTSVGNIHKHGKSEVEETSQQNEEHHNESTGSKRQALKARAFSQVTTDKKRSTFVMSVENSTQQLDDLPQTSIVSNTQKGGSKIQSESLKEQQAGEKALYKGSQSSDQVSSKSMESPKQTPAGHESDIDDSNIIRIEVYSKSRSLELNDEETATSHEHSFDISEQVTSAGNLKKSSLYQQEKTSSPLVKFVDSDSRNSNSNDDMCIKECLQPSDRKDGSRKSDFQAKNVGAKSKNIRSSSHAMLPLYFTPCASGRGMKLISDDEEGEYMVSHGATGKSASKDKVKKSKCEKRKPVSTGKKKKYNIPANVHEEDSHHDNDEASFLGEDNESLHKRRRIESLYEKTALDKSEIPILSSPLDPGPSPQDSKNVRRTLLSKKSSKRNLSKGVSDMGNERERSPKEILRLGRISSSSERASSMNLRPSRQHSKKAKKTPLLKKNSKETRSKEAAEMVDDRESSSEEVLPKGQGRRSFSSKRASLMDLRPSQHSKKAKKTLLFKKNSKETRSKEAVEMVDDRESSSEEVLPKGKGSRSYSSERASSIDPRPSRRYSKKAKRTPLLKKNSKETRSKEAVEMVDDRESSSEEVLPKGKGSRSYSSERASSIGPRPSRQHSKKAKRTPLLKKNSKETRPKEAVEMVNDRESSSEEVLPKGKGRRSSTSMKASPMDPESSPQDLKTAKKTLRIKKRKRTRSKDVSDIADQRESLHKEVLPMGRKRKSSPKGLKVLTVEASNSKSKAVFMVNKPGGNSVSNTEKSSSSISVIASSMDHRPSPQNSKGAKRVFLLNRDSDSNGIQSKEASEMVDLREISLNDILLKGRRSFSSMTASPLDPGSSPRDLNKAERALKLNKRKGTQPKEAADQRESSLIEVLPKGRRKSSNTTSSSMNPGPSQDLKNAKRALLMSKGGKGTQSKEVADMADERESSPKKLLPKGKRSYSSMIASPIDPEPSPHDLKNAKRALPLNRRKTTKSKEAADIADQSFPKGVFQKGISPTMQKATNSKATVAFFVNQPSGTLASNGKNPSSPNSLKSSPMISGVSPQGLKNAKRGPLSDKSKGAESGMLDQSQRKNTSKEVLQKGKRNLLRNLLKTPKTKKSEASKQINSKQHVGGSATKSKEPSSPRGMKRKLLAASGNSKENPSEEVKKLPALNKPLVIVGRRPREIPTGSVIEVVAFKEANKPTIFKEEIKSPATHIFKPI